MNWSFGQIELLVRLFDELRASEPAPRAAEQCIVRGIRLAAYLKDVRGTAWHDDGRDRAACQAGPAASRLGAFSAS